MTFKENSVTADLTLLGNMLTMWHFREDQVPRLICSLPTASSVIDCLFERYVYAVYCSACIDAFRTVICLLFLFS